MGYENIWIRKESGEVSEAILLPSGRTEHTEVIPDVCYFELFLKYLLPLMNLITSLPIPCGHL